MCIYRVVSWSGNSEELCSEMLDLNLGWDIGYPDCGFKWLSPVRPGKCWVSTSYIEQATTTSFQSFQIHIFAIIL
jgi:hypothetical protein